MYVRTCKIFNGKSYAILLYNYCVNNKINLLQTYNSTVPAKTRLGNEESSRDLYFKKPHLGPRLIKDPEK